MDYFWHDGSYSDRKQSSWGYFGDFSKTFRKIWACSVNISKNVYILYVLCYFLRTHNIHVKNKRMIFLELFSSV
jgi:hypothetical protein